MHRLVAAMLLLFASASLAGAAEVTRLYRAETIVTGTEDPERGRGFRIGLDEVITKLTGRSDLPPHPARLRALEAPHGLVTDFEYENRMKDIPIHDEQGTRERPHFLRMTFDTAKMDALIAQMGLAKWEAERPRLAVLLSIRDARRSYVLSSDGEHGYGQREVLKSASARAGLPILIPSEKVLQERDVTPATLPQMRNAVSAALAMGGDGGLVGALTLDKDGAYWDVRWRLDCEGVTDSWRMEGVGFDAALRGAIERAALKLSSER